MARPFDIALRVLPAAIVLVISAAPSDAQWTDGGTPVCTAPANQKSPAIVTDGAGDVLVAWEDERDGTSDIYLQRFTALGEVAPGWPIQGLAICALPGQQTNPVIVSDGEGGAIVSWLDTRSGAPQVFVHRAMGSGTLDPAWTPGGTAVAAASWSAAGLAIVENGLGGAYVAWSDAEQQCYPEIGCSPGPYHARVRRVEADGTLGWISFVGYQTDRLVEGAVFDGAGGVIVAWTASADIHALRLTSSGTVAPGWQAGGSPVCVEKHHQGDVQLAPDGHEGAFVVWADHRAGQAADVYAQHLDGAGNPAGGWPVDGLAVAGGPGFQSFPDVQAQGDGLWCKWVDDFRPRLVRLDATGGPSPGWPAGGVLVRNTTTWGSSFLRDGGGGAIVVWSENRAGQLDLYAQHLGPDGVHDPQWPADGLAVSTAAGHQDLPVLVPGLAGQAVVAWIDGRDEATTGTDIYAGLLAFEVATVASPASVERGLRLLAPRPNPMSDVSRAAFVLASDSPAALELYDVAGRLQWAKHIGNPGAGPHVVPLEVGNALPAGLYFLRLTQEGESVSVPLVIVR